MLKTPEVVPTAKMTKSSRASGPLAIKRLSIIGVALLFTVVADRVSKEWALENLKVGEPQQFWPGILQMHLTSNTGAAFSLGSDQGLFMGILASVLTIILIVWAVRRSLDELPLPAVELFGIGCLIGGAAGNLIDRYTVGRVTDFLEFAFMKFPVFNVADALIDTGIALIAIGMFISARRQKEQDSVETA